jgi:hypothetical protein
MGAHDEVEDSCAGGGFKILAVIGADEVSSLTSCILEASTSV